MSGILATIAMLSAGLPLASTPVRYQVFKTQNSVMNKIKRIHIVTPYCVSDADIDLVWTAEGHY
jgi:hypothetical protein